MYEQITRVVVVFWVYRFNSQEAFRHVTMIKEEPIEESYPVLAPTLPDDEVIASYDVVIINSPKHKVMSVAGLSNVIENSNKFDVSIRTDLKEIKVASRLNDNHLSICYTKETNLNLNKRFYAIKLSRETGNAYFVPITSTHTISFLDESNKSNKEVDHQNVIFEDCFKTPHPARNKHDQLCVEMKNYLFKPLKCIVNPEYVKHFIADLFACTTKRQPFAFTEYSNKLELARPTSAVDSINIVGCPHWHLSRINLCDIKQIDVIELQIEALLRKGQAMTFAEIQEILQVDAPKLLSVLQTIAVLVLGNWVIKSNLLYKINLFHDSDVKQVHLKDLIAARDFLLWILASKRKITFANIYAKFKKSSDHEEILNRLSVRCGMDEPVSFIMPEDENFLRMFATNISNIHKNTIRLLEKHKSYLDS